MENNVPMGAKLVAEPSGATAPAAALSGRISVPAGRMAVVISGGNIAPERLAARVEAASLSAAAVSSA